MINWKWFTQNGEEKVDNLTEGHQYIDYSRKMDKRIFPEQRDKKKKEDGIDINEIPFEIIFEMTYYQ